MHAPKTGPGHSLMYISVMIGQNVDKIFPTVHRAATFINYLGYTNLFRRVNLSKEKFM